MMKINAEKAKKIGRVIAVVAAIGAAVVGKVSEFKSEDSEANYKKSVEDRLAALELSIKKEETDEQ